MTASHSANKDSSAKKKLYVGCGLTLAPQSFRDSVAMLKKTLNQDWEILEFLGLVKGTDEDVYRNDIFKNVATCDAFLAVVDQPSLGLGWEMREALELKKPTLLVAAEGATVTRLVLGAVKLFPDTIKLRRYRDLQRDVPGIVRKEFTYLLDSLD